MNISKLLKITALSCIGLFSVNNSIVNASTDEETNAIPAIDVRATLDMRNRIPNITRIQTLKNQNLIEPITSVNNCTVDAFPRDRVVLITNNHNLFVYLNGVVVVYYVFYDPDDLSNRLITQDRRESNEDIINMFGGLNNHYKEDGVLDILNEDGTNIIYVTNIIKAIFGNDYEIICD